MLPETLNRKVVKCLVMQKFYAKVLQILRLTLIKLKIIN